MNVDEMVAQLLVAEGFSTLEEVAYVDLDELTSIDGFDQNTAEELQARARESLEEINAKAIEHATELGVEQSLFDFEGLTPQMIEALAEDGIKTLEEFATLRRLGARRRLHHRRRQAGQGHGPAREVRHEPRGGADAGDERPRPARLGRSGRPGADGADEAAKTRRTGAAESRGLR